MEERQNITVGAHNRDKARFTSILFWIFLAVVVLVILYRIFYFFQIQKKQLIDNNKNNLVAIANLKRAQIEDWRADQINNAEFVYSDKTLNKIIRTYHEENSPELKNQISKSLRSITTKHGFKSSCVYDNNGKIIYGDSAFNRKKDLLTNSNILDVIKNKKIKLTDFHFSADSGYIHIDLFIPVHIDNDPVIKELIAFEIDPYIELYPRIRSWPASSESGECMLVEKSGSNALFLNELRFQKNAALKLKLDTSLGNILAVMAIKGDTGIVEGVDYHSEPVIGVINAIKDSPWYLIAKIRKDELFSQINQTQTLTTFLIALLLFIALSVTLYYEKGQKTLHYKKLYESELKSKLLAKHFEYLIKYANDIILLISKDGKILEVNDKAVETYGYSLEEFMNLNYDSLIVKNDEEDRQKTLEVFEKEESILFEAMHTKQDGNIFPVEISARKINIEGHTFYQGIIRDITERKKAEEKIIGLNRVYAVLSQINEAIVWINDREKLFERVCEIIITFGKFKLAWIGLIDEDSGLVKPVAHKGFDNGYLNDINVTVTEEPGGKGPTGKAIRTGKYVVCNDIKNDPDMAPWCRKALEHGFLSTASFPLRREGKIIGTLNLYSEYINFFKDDELALLEEVSVDISYAIDTMIKETQRQAAINAMSNSEKKFKTVFESANDAIMLIENNEFIDFNIKAEEIFGLTRENLLHKTPAELSPEYQNDGTLSTEKSFSILQKANKGEPVQYEWVHKKPDGTLFDTEVSLASIILGSKTFLLAVVRDVTEKKRIIESITKARDFYLDLFNEFPAMIWRSGTDTKTNYVNKSWLQFTGKTFEQAISDSFAASVHPDDRWKCTKIYLDSFKLHESFTLEYRLLNTNGEYRWMEDVGRPYFDINGNFAGYIGVCFDITDRIETEEKMRIAMEKAEDLNKLKSSFLANMSHELRTPMTGILGFSEILFSELSEGELKDMAGMILKGGKRLTNTLNSILDLSRIEADRMDIKLEVVNVGEAVKESVAFFEAAAKEKGLSLSCEIKEPVFANLDDRIFGQVLANLIQNAVTYTLKGSILVTAEKAISNNSESAVIKVIDTGIGIPESYLTAIFEPFRQVSSGLGRTYEGTGLGLTITKKFIELMNGTITVESVFKEGSVFTVSFPATEEISSAVEKTREFIKEHTKETVQSKKKILLVEDDEDNQAAIKMILKNICELEITDNGTEAIEMAGKFRYTAILMDIGLKGMSGLETAQEIKKISGYESTPIVAVTAYAMVGDKEKFLSEGCTHYISKPFKANEFRELVKSLI